MGLENFWQIDKETPGQVDGDFNIKGGPFSNKGNTSFRGKGYDYIIEPLTGISLYADVIETDTILKMNEKIQECSTERALELANAGLDGVFSKFEMEEEEWKDFKRMWDAHAKAGHYLVSWS